VTVYVDDMYRLPMGQFRGMSMSHMIATTDDELHAMAARIGMERRWFQQDHYDVPFSKRVLAVQYGAVEITMRQLAALAYLKRVGAEMGDPATARERFRLLRRGGL
jgi:hypothetical protein